MSRAAGAVTALAVAGLCHESRDDTVERYIVVKSLARKLFDTRSTCLGATSSRSLMAMRPYFVSIMSIFCCVPVGAVKTRGAITAIWVFGEGCTIAGCTQQQCSIEIRKRPTVLSDL